MSQGHLVVVIVVFAIAILLSVVMITVAVMIRRRRLGAQRSGPGSAPPAQSPWLRFGAALAAVYARREWHDTRGAKRTVRAEQTYLGYACALPYPMLRSSLARDWNVRSADQARRRISGVLDVVSSDTDRLPSLAFDLARFANLVRWCGAIGYITEEEAHTASDALATAAVTAFDSWEEYGEHYLLGLEQHIRRGRKPMHRAVEWLRTDPESPWGTVPWPATVET